VSLETSLHKADNTYERERILRMAVTKMRNRSRKSFTLPRNNTGTEKKLSKSLKKA
jgi:hypothetical protein